MDGLCIYSLVSETFQCSIRDILIICAAGLRRNGGTGEIDYRRQRKQWELYLYRFG